jgi:hypothetical protein
MNAVTGRVCRVVLATSLVGWAPALAQHGRTGVPPFKQEGFSLSLMGGGVSTFQSLNIAGTEYLGGGPYVGGGLTWQPSADQDLAIRAVVGWTRHVLTTPRPGNGTVVNYVAFGPEIDYALVISEHFKGGIYGGAGGVFIRENVTGASKLHPYARLGLDGAYILSRRLWLVARVGGDIYELSNFPTTSPLGAYHHRQGDGMVAAGIALKL